MDVGRRVPVGIDRRCAMRCVCAWLVVIVEAAGICLGAEDPKTPIDAKAAFAKLKGLAGEWNATGDHPATVVYKVTAAGSVVVEELFPESDHAMISVYHLDGDDLTMTHYCAAGNQPRMKLDRAASTPEVFVFAFNGGTNLDPAKDTHMHEQTMTFKDRDTIEAKYQGYANGKPEGEPLTVVLKRK